jgi:hypothetical protein
VSHPLIPTPLIHFGTKAGAPSGAPASAPKTRVHPHTFEPAPRAARPRVQPKKLRARAARLRVRASRSLPYPTARYAIRQETRDRVFEETWDEGEKWGMTEDDARARARLGSGRREVFD